MTKKEHKHIIQWLESTGCEYLNRKEDGKHYKYYVKTPHNFTVSIPISCSTNFDRAKNAIIKDFRRAARALSPREYHTA